MINLFRAILSQIVLHISTNKKLQEYSALKAIELLRNIANKTNNNLDNKIVDELEELLKRLEIIK